MESFHRVGGYPDCIQGDPKLTAQLVSRGLYCGDQSGYVEGKKRGLWVGAADWISCFRSTQKVESAWNGAAADAYTF